MYYKGDYVTLKSNLRNTRNCGHRSSVRSVFASDGGRKKANLRCAARYRYADAVQYGVSITP